MTEDTSFEIIGFDEWRMGIAPLWSMQGREDAIGRILHGHGQLRYMGREPYRRMLLFPLAASKSGTRVGWASVYNISDTALRIRGIYVSTDYRGQGVGRGLVNYGASLWPPQFAKVFMYARISNVGRYRRWGFETVKGHEARCFEMDHLVDDKEVILMRRDREPK